MKIVFVEKRCTMLNFIKRLFCKHRWVQLGSYERIYINNNIRETYLFGCKKCGEVKEISDKKIHRFIFQQTHKGETIE